MQNNPARERVSSWKNSVQARAALLLLALLVVSPSGANPTARNHRAAPVKDENAIICADCDPDPSPGGNSAPTVSITTPANNTSKAAPATFALTATAADSDGTVVSVKFYSGTTL